MDPVETYLRELRDIRSTGAAVPETSYYGPLATLLNEIGKTLKPKVRCVINLAVTAGWGNPGRAGITMPAGGDARRREYLQGERQTPASLGAETLDIYLNDRVYWRNIPAAVWEYTLGGYQVIKKWLSYREHKMLGRPIRADEARYVTEMARRIAAILLMQPTLDDNYRRGKEAAFAWPVARSMGGGRP